MSNFSISLVIGASVGGALAGIGQVKKSLQVLSDDSLTKGQRIGELFKMGAAGSSAVISSVTGIGTAIMAASQPAIQFESAMADVKKVVDFKSPEGFANLSKDILELSRSIPLTQTELAQIAASGGQLGVAEQDIKSFTETIAKMSTAFDMPAQHAGDSMAKLANVYKIPIDSIGKLGDAINTLSNNSPAKASEIVDTLGRVAGLAKPFGLTENQAAALSGTFIALGKSPEVAGTAINGMLTTLSTLDPKSKKVNGAFKSMGLDISKFKEQVKTDGQGAIMMLLESIEKLPEADRIGILTEIFGKEYADDIAALSGGVGEYRKQLELLQQTDANGNPKYLGSMEEEFKKRSETTANNIQLLKNNFNEVAITIGSVLLPVINDLISWLRPMIEGFADWANAHPNLVSWLTRAALGLTGLIVGIAAAAAVVPFFVGTLAVFPKSAKVAAIALKFMTGQYGLLSTAMRLGLPVRKFVAFGNFMKGFGKGLFSPLIKGFGFLKSIPLNPLKALPMLFGAAKGAIMGAVGAVKAFGLAFLANPMILAAVAAIAVAAFLIYKYWEPIKAFFTGVWQGISAGLEPLKASFGGLWDSIVEAFAPLSGVFDGIVSILGAVWSQIQPLVQPILDWFGEFFSQSQAGVEGASSFGAAVGGAIVGILTAIISIATQIVGFWSTILGAVLTIAVAIWQGVAAVIGGVWSFITGLWSGAVGFFAGLWQSVSAVVMGVWTGITGFLGSIWATIRALVSAGIQGLMAIIRSFSPVSAFSTAFSAVWGFLSGIVGRFRTFGVNIIQGLIGGIKSMAGAVTGAISSVVGNVASRAKSMLGINSPSRLFRQFGAWVSEGLAIGINKDGQKPVSAIGRVAKGVTAGFGEKMGDLSAVVSTTTSAHQARMAGVGNAANGNITIHYQPTITADGQNRHGIEQLLKLSQREFEKMFQKMMQDRQRRAY